MAAMLFGNISSASAEESVTVYGEYLTDSGGYNYGVDYFVDSDVATQIYVAPYIIARENVTGSLISGVMLIEANEKHVRIGSRLRGFQHAINQPLDKENAPKHEHTRF